MSQPLGVTIKSAPAVSVVTIASPATSVGVAGAYIPLSERGTKIQTMLAPSGGDDYTQITAALAEYSTVYLSGAFKTSAKIKVKEGKLLAGFSRTTSIAATAIGYIPIELEGQKPSLWHLTITASGNETTAVVYGESCTDPSVRDVKVTNGRWGIEFKNSTRPRVKECEVTEQLGAFAPVGIYIVGETEGADLQNNYVHDTGGLGIMCEHVTSTQTKLAHRIQNNRVLKCEDNGIRIQTNPAHAEQGRYNVSNNLVEEPKVNCIRVTGFAATVVGNTCIGGEAGIRDTGEGSTVLSRSTITGNTCLNTSGEYHSGGIELHETAIDNTITGNTCEGWLHGINHLGTRATISGNTCRLNKGAGIFCQGDKNTQVSGNKCWNNCQGEERAGIEINSTCSHIVLTGNRCGDDQEPKKQKYGINLVKGSDFCTVVGNDVSGNLTKNLEYAEADETSHYIAGNPGADLPKGAVTMGGSPATALNKKATPSLYLIQGGTVEKIEYGRFLVSTEATTFQDTGVTQGAILVQPLDRLRITYAVAPTVTRIPTR